MSALEKDANLLHESGQAESDSDTVTESDPQDSGMVLLMVRLIALRILNSLVLC